MFAITEGVAMNLYTVTWDIDIEADTPEDAARQAREIQLRADSIATVFQVYDNDAHRTIAIDLTEIDTGEKP